MSFEDLIDRSEFDRDPEGLVGPDNEALGKGVIRGPTGRVTPGVLGAVAIGVKEGSTIGLVMTVCRAVKKRRGPAGLGTTIISGTGEKGVRVD